MKLRYQEYPWSGVRRETKYRVIEHVITQEFTNTFFRVGDPRRVEVVRITLSATLAFFDDLGEWMSEVQYDSREFPGFAPLNSLSCKWKELHRHVLLDRARETNAWAGLRNDGVIE